MTTSRANIPDQPGTDYPIALVLPNNSPLVWPDPRCTTGLARHESQPPFAQLAVSADLVAGVLVGVSDGTIQWLQDLFRNSGPRQVRLAILVFPTGPTREQHLLALKMIQGQVSGLEKQLEIRVRPTARVFGPDFEIPSLPPTTFLAHDSKLGRSWLSIGSVGDAGRDHAQPTSFNVLFHPDDALRDSWRRWFQFVFSSAAPLTIETVRNPHLVPVPGDPKAAELWQEFENACRGTPAKVFVDAKPGEVTEADGWRVEPWDGGKTALDSLAQMLQQVYAEGWLVTVDETTRMKPLAIPVKATLLGQQFERTVGALTHKQSFTLQLLEDPVAKEVKKCRRVTDLMDLLTYLLSLGNRWLPEAAKGLFEKEMEARNKAGLATLKNALGGDGVGQFVQKRQKSIRENLNAMYSQLGQGKAVPEDKLTAVLTEVAGRLNAALSARITPRAVYNRIAPPDLTGSALEENWAQPLSLLLRSARLMRESLTDAYFPRRLSGLSFKEDEFRAAMDVFGDLILKDPDPRRAKEELAALDKIETNDQKPREKCSAVWRLIAGGFK